MTVIAALPENVRSLLLDTLNAEFATVSGAGVPIDTPMLIFPTGGLQTFDVCTGVAYPAKAERARNNPKVGLLFEGGKDRPVVSIAGLAAVRDSDIQANTLRYLGETAWARPLNPPWSVARKAVYYWSRLLVAITPVRVLWWDSPEAMDGAPQRWDAPAGAIYPKSDPKPTSAPSVSPKWPEQRWQDLAEGAIKLGLPHHLTLCDKDGYPLPIRARALKLTATGFEIGIPAGAPWPRTGKGSLTFVGRETFIGNVQDNGDMLSLTVERALPINPFMNDPREFWEPSQAIYDAMMGRLQHELARRGQSIPVLPETEPELTEYAKLRRAKLGENFETSLPTE
jgi:hypothetical protein